MTYYSQNGEDFIADKLLTKKKGFFVEIGCIDGRRFSNTLHFEENDWKGLCVEAHQDYIDYLYKNRSAKIVNCAVGAMDADEITFYANKRGSLSTLDKSKESFFSEKYGKYFTGFVEQSVKVKKLDTIFSENNVSNIDILSIDIEGTELDALQGLNLNKYRPEIIIVECSGKDEADSVCAFLSEFKYFKIYKTGENLFFVNNDKYIDLLCKIDDTVNLKHTAHPFVNDDIDMFRKVRFKPCANIIDIIRIKILNFLYKIIYKINAISR